MKKLSNKLFETNKLNEKMSTIIGGVEGNGSDKTYTDTKIDQGKWDVATQKLIDVEITSTANDNPKRN